MNSFSFTLSVKHFICLLILNDSFAGYSNLGCRSLLFIILNTFCQPCLVWLTGLSIGLRTNGRWFDSQSGHMPGLWARSPVVGT